MTMISSIIILSIVVIIDGTIFPSAGSLLPKIQAFAFNTAATSNDLLNKANIAELLDIGSGIFAVVLAAFSLTAYRNLKATRLILVSVAFAMFAVHAIVTGIAFFVPGIEASLMELIVSFLSFGSLAFFFLALVKKPRVKPRTTASSPSSS